MKKKTFQIVRFFFLGLGLFLLIQIVRKIGLSEIQTQLARLGFLLVPILALGFFWYLCYTHAWRLVLKQQGTPPSFWHLFRIKIVGETINTLTPFNFLGGDPMRIYLLRRFSNPTAVAASVVADRTINSLAIVVVISMGAAAAFLMIPGLPFFLGAGIALFLLFTIGVTLFLLLKQQKGLFHFLASLFAKKHLAKAQALDEKLLAFYRTSHKTFWLALAFHMIGRVLGILEIYLIGKIAAPQFSLLIALILATLSPLIHMLFTFVPGAIGILEGAYSAALFLLGLEPALGLTIQIIKRMRAGVWMGLGLSFILWFRDPQKDVPGGDPLRQPL